MSPCPTITGDVTIATNAAGSIKLNGVESIEGNLRSEDCFGGEAFALGFFVIEPQGFVPAFWRPRCSGLLSLSCPSLVSVSQNVTLLNMLNITSISLPELEKVGSPFYLDGLPSLTSVSIPKLSSVGYFHLAYAPALSELNLQGLTNLSSVYINNVGLTSMPAINVTTKVESFVVGGVPNMPMVEVWTPDIGLLQVNGNGFTGVATYKFGNGVAPTSIDSFSISGCGTVLLYGEFKDGTTSNKNFIATGNSFQSLDLTKWSTNGSVYIQGNPQLQAITWNYTRDVLESLVLKDNPLLNNFDGFLIKNISTLELVGAFDTKFL